MKELQSIRKKQASKQTKNARLHFLKALETSHVTSL